MEDIKPKPLTEEEITRKVKEEGASPITALSIIWAKQRSDEYWKSILLEEVEKALNYGAIIGDLTNSHAKLMDLDRKQIFQEESEEYIKSVKQRLGI